MIYDTEDKYDDYSYGIFMNKEAAVKYGGYSGLLRPDSDISDREDIYLS